MEELGTWSELFIQSLRSTSDKIGTVIPSLVGAILIFLLGWLLAKFLSFVILRLLKAFKFDSLSEKVPAQDYLDKAGIQIKPSKILSKLVYWIILLLVLITASETLGWDVVSDQISSIVSYLPKLFIAILLFILGSFIASFIRDVISGATSSLGISTGKIISQVVFYFLLITVTLTALNQAGIDTTIITSNLLLILGAILIAAAISYGFASREILKNILSGFFTKNTYRIGMYITVNDISGKIEKINSLNITLLNDAGDLVVIPTSLLVNTNVTIKKESI